MILIKIYIVYVMIAHAKQFTTTILKQSHEIF